MTSDVHQAPASARPPVPSRKRFRTLRMLRTVVSLALLAWVVHAASTRAGVDALYARLSDLRWAWLFSACALPCVAVLFGALRWQVLLVEEHIALPFSWLLKHTLIGRFIGAFTPSTTGLDGYRTLAVARKTSQALAASRALVLEKVVGLAGLAAVTGLCAALGVTGISGRTALLGIAVSLGCAFVGYVVVRQPARLLSLVPLLGRVSRVRKLLSDLSGSTARRGPLLLAIALGLISHAATAAVFVASAWAVNVDLGAAALFGVGNAIVIAILLPVSVGGLGVREGVAMVLLGALGIDEGAALLVAVVGYLAGQTPAIVGGVLAALSPAETPSLSATPSSQPDVAA